MKKEKCKSNDQLKKTLLVAFLVTKSIGYGAPLLDIGSIYFNDGTTEQLLISDKSLVIDQNKKITGGIYLDLIDPNTDSIKITNNGYILPTGNKNGIYFDTRDYPTTTLFRNINIDEIKNNGLIIAKDSLGREAALVKSGNGVYIYNGSHALTLGNFINNGLIAGHYKSTSISTIGKSHLGNGVTLSGGVGSTINLFENKGVIKGETSQHTAKKNVGNGVYTEMDTISVVKNEGLISGNANYLGLTGSNTGFGMLLRAKVDSFENKGVITGYIEHGATLSGVGVWGAASISDFNNSGVITGKTGTGAVAKKGNTYAIGVKIDTSLVDSIIENIGLIAGYQLNTVTSGFAGNGMELNLMSVAGKTTINNKGIVSGYEGAQSLNGATNPSSGNGIKTGEQAKLVIENTGTISSYNSLGTTPFDHSPSGINVIQNGLLDSSISNNGVIKSNVSAIHIDHNRFKPEPQVSKVVNNGILAGQNIVEIDTSSTNTTSTIDNNGVFVYLKEDGTVNNIVNGAGGVIAGKTILNSGVTGSLATNDLDSSTTISSDTTYSDYIINGAGISTGALNIENGAKVTTTDSVINGYKTAVHLKGDNSSLIATNTIFNGGGIENKDAIIKGDLGSNKLNISGNSIINGSVDLGDGEDTLTLGNTVQINGNLNGGLGDDTLNLGEKLASKNNSTLNIFHEIASFEKINTNSNVTLFETAKVSDGNINIESGDLTLRIDSSQRDSNDYITGHALYNHTGNITSSGGKFVMGLNGLGENAIIATNGSIVDESIDTAYDEDKNKLRTDSLVLNATLLADKNIKITLFEDLPLIPLEPSIPVPPVDPPLIPLEPSIPVPPVDPPLIPLEPSKPVPPTVTDDLLYIQLNKVYKSIISAGEIGKLANTTYLGDKTYEESLGGLLTMLDQIYANSPYSYTLKSSRDSLKLFEDNISYLTIKPKKHELITQGKAIYTGVKNDNTDNGKNYYGFDTGHRNYNTTTNTIGGLATFEYGLTDKTSVGLVVGGNNQSINFKGSSEVEGTSVYVGTFAKTEMNNFRFMGGLGYQYTSVDADREVSNGYDSFKTNDKYDVNSYNAFLEAKYVYEGTQNWRVEPKARLSYYSINQGSVDEGYNPGQLSIEVDKASSDTLDLEVGVDFVKTVQLEKGKLNNIFSLGVINTLGSDSKKLRGRILGANKKGSDFEIQETELPDLAGKASYNLELEQTNGIIYTAGVSIEFSKDYNRNVNATIGIGYKF